jgi:flagellar basal body rod protein FlgC
MPNVTLEEEYVDMLDARRMFEANATAFQVAKAVLRRALEI